MSSSSSASYVPSPLRVVTTGIGVEGGGGPPHDPTMEARIAALEGRFDRIETKLDQVDGRLRAVETSIAALDGKVTVLVNSVVGKLPTWWQMPAVIFATVSLLAAMLALASRLHLIAG